MSLIAPGDQWAQWAAVGAAAAAGMRLERTPAGQALSGAVCSMLITATMTNVGILPAVASPHIGGLQALVVKLATPLLLLGADLNKILRDTGSLLKAFALAACGTALGATLGAFLLREQLRGVDQVWAVLSAVTAKNIGGGLNFVAVADVLKVPPGLVSTALAVDNVLGLMYFPLVSWLGGSPGSSPTTSNAPDVAAVAAPLPTPHRRSGSQPGAAPDGPLLCPDSAVESAVAVTDSAKQRSASSGQAGITALEVPPKDAKLSVEGSGDWTVEAAATTLATGLILTAVAEGLAARWLPGASIPVCTALTVLLATAAPKLLAPLIPVGDKMGRLLLFLFFASVGATSGTVATSLMTGTAGVLFAFGLVLYAVHLVVALGGGRLFGLARDEILVASNASIGNPATASALAAAKRWDTLVLPALLVGTLGNAFGTFAGLWLGSTVLKGLIG